ncbi:MAG: TetR/AcrR family transcriptional regulator [Candidatus Nanopelagicales bacterium]
MTPQGPTYHHGALSEALIDTAFRHVQADGSASLSLRSLAHELGVSPSAAYNHFADKEALLNAVTAQCHVALDQRMDAAAQQFPGTSDADLIGRFQALGRAYIDFAEQEPRLFSHAFKNMCDFNPDAAAESRAYALLCSILDELGERHLLRPGIREGLDMTIWVSVHGFAELALSGNLPFAAAPLLIESLQRLIIQD